MIPCTQKVYEQIGIKMEMNLKAEQINTVVTVHGIVKCHAVSLDTLHTLQ